MSQVLHNPLVRYFLIKRIDNTIEPLMVIQQPDGSWPEPVAEIVKWHETRQSQVDSWREVEFSDFPTDRVFREAWRDTGKAVEVDMPIAREIHRGRLREARAPKLAALDVEYMRADEIGDVAKKKEIAARKQALRDVTVYPGIEKAQTPDELKAIWPEILDF